MKGGRLNRWLEQLLHTHDTPRRTAAAYGLGVFLGFSPFLGLHTILGLVAAFALNLNRVATMLGVYSNLPWILPAYYTVTTAIGAAILGVRVPPGILADLSSAFAEFSLADFNRLLAALAPLLGAFLLGSTLGAIVLALIGYRVSLTMIVAHRKRIASRQQDEENQ